MSAVPVPSAPAMFRIFYVKGAVRTFTPAPGERGPGVVRMLPGWGIEGERETAVKLHNLTANQGYAVFLAYYPHPDPAFDVNDALRALVGADFPAGVYEL